MSYLVFNIGCIECGVSLNLVGQFETLEEAKSQVERLAKSHSRREGGQNVFEVFELSPVGQINEEYKEETT